MKSTQLKVSRRWKTQIAMQKIRHPKTNALLTPGSMRLCGNSLRFKRVTIKAHGIIGLAAKHGLQPRIFLVRQLFEQVMKGAVKAVDETEPQKDDVPF